MYDCVYGEVLADAEGVREHRSPSPRLDLCPVAEAGVLARVVAPTMLSQIHLYVVLILHLSNTIS